MVQLVKIVSNSPANKSTTYLGDDGNTYVLTGDLNQRANNPGNISPTGTRDVYESQFGAIGYLPSSKGEPAVAVFPTLQQGQAAQAYLWSTPAYQNKTIAQAASSWASAPYVNTLVSAAGASKDTLIKDLSPQQMQALTSAQAGVEGSGLRISDASGNPVQPSLFQGNGLDAINNALGVSSPSALAYANGGGSLVPLPRPRPDPTPAFYGRLPATAANGVDRLNADGSPTPTPTDFTSNPLGNYDPSMQGMLTPQAPRMDPVGSGPGTFSQLQSAFAVPPPLPIPRPNPLPPVPASRNASIDMVAPGNIDLNNRQVYFGNDGTYGTEHSFSIGTPKGEVLIPQIVNGKLVSQQDAINHYMQTGENLGTFTTPAAANAYATQLHERDQGLADMPVPQSRPASLSLPDNPTHGQRVQGPDGSTYQYVQLTGGNFNSPAGQWGWEKAENSTNAPAATSSAQHLVNLNGKMVPVGTYPSPSNPGSTFTVSDDGTGKGVVKNNDLGFMNPAKMGQGTVAGGMIGKALADAAPEVQQAVNGAVSNVGATASQIGSNIGSTAQNLAGGALTALGNLFGGGNKAPPTPSVPAFAPKGNSWTPAVSAPPAPTPSFVPSGSSWTPPAPAPAAPTTKTIVNPAYTAWQAQYGNQGGLATGTSENTVSSKFNDGGDLAIPKPIPPAPAPTIKITVPAVPVPVLGTPPGMNLGLTSTAVPPIPMANPSWLAPVMPQSAVFASNPIAQLVAQSKYGNAAQFLSGSQNNYGYIVPQNGMDATATHAALMAQQNKATGARSTGNPYLDRMNPNNFASDNFEDRL